MELLLLTKINTFVFLQVFERCWLPGRTEKKSTKAKVCSVSLTLAHTIKIGSGCNFLLGFFFVKTKSFLFFFFK